VIPVTLEQSVPGWFDGNGSESDVVVSTRVRLARNLADCRFPRHASLAEKKDVFETLSESIGRIGATRDLSVINFTRVSRLEQDWLAEERVVSRELVETEGDRGVACDDARRIALMINEEDHLRLSCMESGSCAEALWKRIDSVDTLLANKVDFAWDDRRGFLTSCPTNAGTGLRVSYLLHLPGLCLTKAIDPVLQGVTQTGMAVRGFFGEHSEIVGHFFQLSNQATMGKRETEFLEATRDKVRQIVELERGARNRLRAQARLEVSDKVFRAYGILRHAKTLSVIEYFNLCSAVRLGMDFTMLPSITKSEINRLSLSVLDAHIRKRYGEQIDDETASIRRAEIVSAFIRQSE